MSEIFGTPRQGLRVASGSSGKLCRMADKLAERKRFGWGNCARLNWSKVGLGAGLARESGGGVCLTELAFINDDSTRAERIPSSCDEGAVGSLFTSGCAWW